MSYLQPMEPVESKHYLAKTRLSLDNYPTLETFDMPDKELKRELEEVREDLGKFQNILWAHRKYSVLICLQGIRRP